MLCSLWLKTIFSNLDINVFNFLRCRESALLLTMPIGSALLLVDALQQDLSLASLTDSSSKDPVVSSPLPSALHEMGIHSLSEFEADQVLQRRRDLTNC
ncbi:unnamed protein product [Rotaria magnacalcarata]|uniref:Uncharacterized protein n=1 Tax=Rotaria magnacalcarata TaxID=392030 RepID=A0A816XPG5_9BILA|nr:unnamed protein product [Rotaria magnacalcarata]